MSFKRIIQNIGRERLSGFERNAVIEGQEADRKKLEAEKKVIVFANKEKDFVYLVGALGLKDIFEEFNLEILEGKGTVQESPVTFVQETRGTWQPGPSWDSGSGSYSGGELAHFDYYLDVGWSKTDEEIDYYRGRMSSGQKYGDGIQREHIKNYIPAHNISFKAKSSTPREKFYWEMRGPHYNSYGISDAYQYLTVRNFEAATFDSGRLTSAKPFEEDVEFWLPTKDNFRALIATFYTDICLKHGNNAAIEQLTKD